MDTFNNLPAPAKAGIALATGAGLMGGIVALTGGNATVLLIIAAGIVVVGLLLVAYKFVLGWLGKRKAAPLERGILNNSAAAPNSISEPARRARLDDMRRSFEGGVEKFRASGKNIYSLPWYVLVGEPGSGKTEAIRHCNVGFPPGLQDQLQGAGGTLNMNWWFTNHAIILDTAGRLMFEEVEPGATSEWKEFLTLLTRVRPNCPINGLLLVIPADSLIRDTADSIERKAGKIAQQLDNIQRQLGVRFPVFIVITKSDLINGFREFFDTLSDPQLQHQIMGWSNPSPLDQPFSPELVERHLQTVAASLSKRRQGLLIDPVNTDDPNGRRVDQVDALYAFPESLLKIAPRLRRYLEMVFVAGEWSPKPLFLRGIYFTSSMREGSALDAELAEALKVPIESLPEGKVWERDRAYFLRDLFLQKVFKEKGLVTRASDTKKLQRNRKMAVMISGFVGVFALLGLTYFGARTLDKNIGKQKDYWSAASSEYQGSPDQWPMIDTKSKPAKYLGESNILVEGGNTPRARFHADTFDMIQKRIDVPWVFKPLRVFSADLNTMRSTAYRAMYESSVLKPMLKATRDRIAAETPESWSDGATLALAQLIRMETYVGGGVPAASAEPPMSLDPVARYVLGKDDYGNYAKYNNALQGSAGWLYGTKDGGGKWPPSGVSADRDNNGMAVIEKGVRTFNQYWLQQVAGRSQRLSQITLLVNALNKFRQAEAAIAAGTKNNNDNLEQFRNFGDIWSKGFGDMTDAKAEADKAIDSLSKDNGWAETQTLGNVFDAEVARISNEATRAYQALINHLPADDKAKMSSELAAVQRALKDAQGKVPTSTGTLTGDPQRKEIIPQLDQFYLARGQDLEKKQSRRYVIHYQVYSRAKDQMAAGIGTTAPTFSTVAGALKKLDDEMEARLKDVAALPSGFTIDQKPIADACATATSVAEISAREKRYQLLMLTLKTAPQNSMQVAQEIAKGAAGFEALTYRNVPLTTFETDGKFSLEYHPEAAREYVSGWKAVGNQLADAKTKPKAGVLNVNDLSTAYDPTNKPISDYLKGYILYWTDDLREKLKVAVFSSWQNIFNGALKGGQWEVKALLNIQDMDDKSQKAIDKIRPFLTPQMVQAINQPQPLTEREYARLEERSRLCVARWRALGDDPETARRTVLDLPQVDFESGYLFPEDEKARLAERYVAQFSMRMLEALANEARKTALGSLARLRQLSRFPLAKPQQGIVCLEEKEVAEARNLMGRIRMGDANAGTAPRAATVREKTPIETLLETLRDLDLKPQDKKFVGDTQALLNVLPQPGKDLRCKIYWASKEEQERYAKRYDRTVPWGAYNYCEIVQASEFPQNKQVNARVITTETAKEILEVVCPGPSIRMRLTPTPTLGAGELGAVFPRLTDKEHDNASPWSLLRLLHGPNGARSDDPETKGKIWFIEVPVPAAEKQSFWLKLEFKESIPEVASWPEGKAQPAP